MKRMMIFVAILVAGLGLGGLYAADKAGGAAICMQSSGNAAARCIEGDCCGRWGCWTECSCW